MHVGIDEAREIECGGDRQQHQSDKRSSRMPERDSGSDPRYEKGRESSDEQQEEAESLSLRMSLNRARSDLAKREMDSQKVNKSEKTSAQSNGERGQDKGPQQPGMLNRWRDSHDPVQLFWCALPVNL